jgi:hypothetical protein
MKMRFSGLQMIFSYELFTGFDVGFHQGQHPETTLLLVAGVQIGVVGLAGLDHLPKDAGAKIQQVNFRCVCPDCITNPESNHRTTWARADIILVSTAASFSSGP